METKRALTTARENKKKKYRPPRRLSVVRDCGVNVYKDGELIRYEIGIEHGDAMFVTACLAKLRRNEELSPTSVERLDRLPAYWRDRLKGKWETPAQQNATR